MTVPPERDPEFVLVERGELVAMMSSAIAIADSLAVINESLRVIRVRLDTVRRNLQD